MRYSIVVVVCFYLFNSCSWNKKAILYDYDKKVTEAIIPILNDIKKTVIYQDIKDFDKTLYVEIRMDNSETIMIFNYYHNMHESVKELVESSNRFLIVNANKIPIVFFTDSSNYDIKTGHYKLVSTGYFVIFDITGNMIDKGLLQ